MEEGKLSQNLFLIKAGLIIGSGGFIFGYDIGVIAGILEQLKLRFELNDVEVGFAVSILYIGSMVASIFGGYLCDSIGRWKTIQVQNVLFIIGALLTSTATSFSVLCLGRFIVGIASALSGIADVPYLNEISPPAYRGLISSIYEMAISIGVLTSFISTLFLSSTDEYGYGWRIAFLIPAIIAVFQSIGMVYLPESPQWLLYKGNIEELEVALSQIYGYQLIHTICSSTKDSRDDMHLTQELKDFLEAKEIKIHNISIINEEGDLARPRTISRSKSAANVPMTSNKEVNYISVNTVNTDNNIQNNCPQTWFQEDELSLLKEYRYTILIIVIIQILSQITGGNVIRNYAPIIFENAGVNDFTSLLFNLCFGVIKVACTFISITSMDNIGRMKLLTLGICLVTIGMLLLAISSIFSISHNISSLSTFLTGCCLITMGFSIGYGPIPWVLSVEMLPTAIRGRIMSVSLLSCNLAQLVSNFVFLPMCTNLGATTTFSVFVCLNIFTFLFVKYFLVETKEISSIEILHNLQDRYNCTMKTPMSNNILFVRSSNDFDIEDMDSSKSLTLSTMKSSTHQHYSVKDDDNNVINIMNFKV